MVRKVVHIVLARKSSCGNRADLSSSCKAPGVWRTPRRFANFRNHRVARSVLDCGGPPPLFPEAYQTVPMLTGTAIGVVNDFIERLDPSGGDVRLDFLDQMIQTTGGGVRFNLLVPILPESVMQTMNQIPLFFGRKLFNGRLDFLNRAHADKIRCKFESANAEMQLEFTLQRATGQAKA